MDSNAILFAGLILFLGIHLLPVVPQWRTRLVGRFGDNGYRARFSAVSGIGLLLIIVGYAYAPRGAQLFSPWPEAIQFAPVAMIASFILFAAANMPTHIKATLKHPMLLGVFIWALTHLLASGHFKATVLFGSFLVYALLDVVSATARGAVKPVTPAAKYDLRAVVVGTLVALLFMFLHRWVIGVKVVPWGV